MGKMPDRPPAGLGYFSPGGRLRPGAAPGRRLDAWPAKPLTPSVSALRADPAPLDDHRSREVQLQFEALEKCVFSVREIASCLDGESRRLSRLYQRLVLQGDPGRRLGSGGMDAALVSPHLSYF